MNWLTPLGFLGALGIVALIIIYIIKPNFQNKRISSTFVWRMSLKYRKKSIPISKIQNLLVFLCQVLILATLTTMLAGPIIERAVGKDDDEVVIIVDASAGMRMREAGKTRFDRALTEAKKTAEKAFDKGASVSLILADLEPEFVLRRELASNKDSAIAVINGLISDGIEICSFGTSNVSEAITLSESVLESNPRADVYLYTDTTYTRHDGVTVVNVARANEWNATVIDTKAELNNDNHYEIIVSAACYGKTEYLTVYCKVHGVNGDENNTVTLEKNVSFDPSVEERLVEFKPDEMASAPIYSYDYIETYMNVSDSFAEDNYFFLYGGRKPTVKIQYSSSSPNNFFESITRTLRQQYRDVWDIQITNLREDELPATSGFDFYIFEHKMPSVMPTDGVVLLVDPTTAPDGSGLQIGGSYSVDSSSVLASGTSHDITKYVNPQRITIAKYNDVVLAEDYEELAFYNGRPVILVKDTDGAKVAVWAFDLNYSNIIALPDFAFLVYNTFNYFIPSTFVGNSFEVGDTLTLMGRGTGLKVSGNGEEYSFESGRGELSLNAPGTYSATQTAMDGETVLDEKFFVRTPVSESNPNPTVDTLPSVEFSDVGELGYRDVLLYFAIALVVLMFAEWAFEIKKNY